MQKIKIGTRASRLALWQAEFVAEELKKKYRELEVELVKIHTTGDKILDSPLAKIGGKGLFTKDIEIKMAEGEINLAVHSLKDVPAELPPEFKIAAITKREFYSDAFVSEKFSSLKSLPENAIVGTSSLRRAAQISAIRPDLQIKNLRGNVETRLKKLDAGEFDAIILAEAGLRRLGYSGRIKEILTEIIPAAGQGALALEIRSNDSATEETINFLNDEKTAEEIKIEREFLKVIGGSCQVPVGIKASISNDFAEVDAIISSPDGKIFIKDSFVERLENIKNFGEKIARQMLDRGGREILRELI